MTNLEHLVENGLTLIEKPISAVEWYNKMKEDINWEGVDLTLDQLWEICQYVAFRYKPDFLYSISETSIF